MLVDSFCIKSCSKINLSINLCVIFNSVVDVPLVSENLKYKIIFLLW